MPHDEQNDPVNEAIKALYAEAAKVPTPPENPDGMRRWMMARAGRVPILPDDQIVAGPLGDHRRRIQREQLAEDARTGRTRP